MRLRTSGQQAESGCAPHPLETVRKSRLICPGCRQAWLIPGARVNDVHVCKSCGHRFTIETRAAQAPDRLEVSRHLKSPKRAG